MTSKEAAAKATMERQNSASMKGLPKQKLKKPLAPQALGDLPKLKNYQVDEGKE